MEEINKSNVRPSSCRFKTNKGFQVTFHKDLLSCCILYMGIIRSQLTYERHHTLFSFHSFPRPFPIYKAKPVKRLFVFISAVTVLSVKLVRLNRKSHDCFSTLQFLSRSSMSSSTTAIPIPHANPPRLQTPPGGFYIVVLL